MASFKELPAKAQMGIIVGVVVALCAGFYFLVLKDQMAKNEKDLKAAKDMEAKVKELEPYQSKLEDLKRQIASLQLQLDIQKRIVPDEKEADKFMKMMQDTATAAGVDQALERIGRGRTVIAVSRTMSWVSGSPPRPWISHL